MFLIQIIWKSRIKLKMYFVLSDWLIENSTLKNRRENKRETIRKAAGRLNLEGKRGPIARCVWLLESPTTTIRKSLLRYTVIGLFFYMLVYAFFFDNMLVYACIIYMENINIYCWNYLFFVEMLNLPIYNYIFVLSSSQQ